MSESKKKFPLWKTIFPVLLVMGMGLWFLTSSKENALQDQPTFAVVKGPLNIRVIETGTIKPQEQLVIINELQGQTTIISLVAEGTKVKAGDLLVELDSSKLIDERTEQEIKVQNAEASFVRARENYAVAKSQAESDISKATLDHRFAKEDQTQYIDGQYPNQLRESESRIALAEEELKRASEKLKWSDVLSKEKYISTTELQADELAARRSKLELELAQNSLKLLQDYTHARRLVELESNISQSEMALERVKRKASADVIQAEAELKARESELNRQKDKLVKNEDQIKKTKITAPRDGLVVYASSAKMSFRGNSDPLQEGQQVRERQELIYLPTNQGMKVEFNIHETQLSMVQLGLRARIDVDAASNKTYVGKIVSIAPLPDANQMWMNPDLKVYPTQLYIDGNDDSLRTGMSCRVEVMVESYTDVLQIPIQAVIRSGRHALVYVQQSDRQFIPREVVVGHDNGSLILVSKGLAEGEKVWLTPPLEPPIGFEYKESVPLPLPEVTRPAVLPPPMEKKINMGEGDGPSAPKKRENMSEEEKQKMRERFQNMSEEEKEKFRSARQKRKAQEGEQP